jgi:hypothetical protein
MVRQSREHQEDADAGCAEDRVLRRTDGVPEPVLYLSPAAEFGADVCSRSAGYS